MQSDGAGTCGMRLVVASMLFGHMITPYVTIGAGSSTDGVLALIDRGF